MELLHLPYMAAYRDAAHPESLLLYESINTPKSALFALTLALERAWYVYRNRNQEVQSPNLQSFLNRSKSPWKHTNNTDA